MLKKRFVLFITGFSILIVILNFSFVSASISGASKIRLLSFSIIFSILEILIASFLYLGLLKSAEGFLKREKQFLLALNRADDGIIIHNDSNEILFLNAKAEEFLGITFKDVAGVRMFQDLSLRNPKLEKILGVLFSLKLNSLSKENFLVQSKEVADGGEKIFIKTIKKSAISSGNENIEFVTTAAHQLRTPLSGIKWVLKMLLDSPNLSPDQISLLKKGNDTNEKVIKIVNDLLDVSKIESGKFIYDFKPLEPVSFLEKTISDFSRLAEEKNIHLSLDKGPVPIPNIKADPDRLSMALNNLIDNAIKYTPSEGEIKISLARKNNFCEISVSDTGAGIPEMEMGKVFSKFFRASNAAKMDFNGSGLGLFIASRIISDHGGQMRFAPNSPAGSVFAFTIPLNDKY